MMMMGAGAKYITPVNLVRIGVAKALKDSVVSRPRFIKNWTMEEDDVLEELWKDIKSCLGSENFGVYYAFRRVFGESVTRVVGERGQFPVPPSA